MNPRPDEPLGGRHLILYDGVCGLCNSLSQFVLRRDPARAFSFASLQSKLAGDILRGYGRDAADLDTLYLLTRYGTPQQALLWKARAALFILAAIGGPWRLAGILMCLPARILDWGYDLIARNRYRLFGRYDACVMPAAEHLDRFLGP